jgi:hypothetical protein
LGTCSSVRVRTLEASASPTPTSSPLADRISDPQVAAGRPQAQPCRLVDLGLFLCSYPLAAPNELSVWVRGGASAGYGVSGIEFVD